MRHFEPVFRPPSEAESLILQITIGCSHNACTFCAMYRNKRYKVRPVSEIREEILEAAAEWPECPRVFLGDGDALAAPTDYLLEVLASLRASLPRLRRVSLYATPMNLLEKSEGDLAALKASGLSLFYLGMESGSDAVLKKVNKGASAGEIVGAVQRGHAAGLRSSVMVLLGLGGEGASEEHALSSAEAANRMQPHYLSVLTWMPVGEAPLTRQVAKGGFALLGDGAVLRELRLMVDALDLKDTVFRANHASNPLPIGGRLNRDKAQILTWLTAAQAGAMPLRPAFMRGT
jgi:radical SAM superfamily enzyme YgiQ (UPF0313 family)